MPPKIIEKRPDAPPENPSQTKFNPFQPEMPRIPGVSDGSHHATRDISSPDKNRLSQILGIAAVILLIGAAILWWSRSKLRASNAATANPEIAEQTSSPSASTFSNPIPPVHEGPSIAGTVEELSKPWSAKKFNFVKPITHENIDAMVMRLPNGDLWAFSLQAPYGNCQLDYVTNLAVLASTYGFRATHPMVVNPCDSTVFDPLKVGTIDGNTWARGQIVQGSSLRPPFAINVKIRGRSIVAEDIE